MANDSIGDVLRGEVGKMATAADLAALRGEMRGGLDALRAE